MKERLLWGLLHRKVKPRPEKSFFVSGVGARLLAHLKEAREVGVPCTLNTAGRRELRRENR